MFAHQVIEALEKFKKTTQYEEVINVSNEFIKQINKSQKFHLGDYDDLFTVYEKMIGKALFNGDNTVKMPFKTMWIDWTHKNHIPKPGESPTTKESVIAENLTDNIILYSCFSYSPDLQTWVPFYAYFMTQIGEKLDKKEESIWKSFTSEKPYKGFTVVRGISNYKGKLMQIAKECSYNITMLNLTLKLLNCKNIQTETIKAPEALNKKRRRNGKQEIFDYHVLNVVVPGKKRGYSPETEPLSHNRVHLCRGHFKEYTSEHPLFGHLTGLYWWQPHVRGQNKSGIVVKDYNVKTA